MAVDAGRGAHAGTFQHRRPEQGVEVNDVLADEVIDLGVRIGLPVAVKVDALLLAQVLEAGEVADRRVQPHVEVLARRVGNLEAEVGRIAGDVPLGQTRLEPFLQLVGNLALHAAALGPLLQELGEVRQLEEVVGGRAHFRRGAGDGRDRIDQLGRRVGRAAGFTVVAVLVFGLALRAGTLDEAVGEEQALDRIEHLLDIACGDMAGIAQRQIDALAVGAVLRRVGGVIVVKADAELGEVGLVLVTHTLDQLLGGDTFLLGTQHDGGAVGVIGAHVMAFVATAFLEAYPDVGLDVLKQVTQVDRPIGIGQGTGNQNLAR